MLCRTRRSTAVGKSSGAVQTLAWDNMAEGWGTVQASGYTSDIRDLSTTFYVSPVRVPEKLDKRILVLEDLGGEEVGVEAVGNGSLFHVHNPPCPRKIIEFCRAWVVDIYKV